MTFSETPRHQLLVLWMKILGPRFEFKRNLPGIALPTNWPKGPCRNKENRGKIRRRTMRSKVDGLLFSGQNWHSAPGTNKTLVIYKIDNSLKTHSKYFKFWIYRYTSRITTPNLLPAILDCYQYVAWWSNSDFGKHGDARSAWKPWVWRRRRALRRLDQLLLRWHPKSHRWRPLDSPSLVGNKSEKDERRMKICWSKRERLKWFSWNINIGDFQLREPDDLDQTKLRLLHRAQRMAQRGGRLRISSNRRVTPTPSEGREARHFGDVTLWKALKRFEAVWPMTTRYHNFWIPDAYIILSHPRDLKVAWMKDSNATKTGQPKGLSEVAKISPWLSWQLGQAKRARTTPVAW